MSTVPITSPAHDNDNFPNTISGTYTLSARRSASPHSGSNPSPQPPPPPPDPITVTVPAPTITVWVKREDTGAYLPSPAVMVTPTSANATTGTWSAPKPTGVLSGYRYTIIVTITHPDYDPGNDKKLHIQG